MMEPEWRKYLRENAPELYDEMLSELEYSLKWRDDYIRKLEEKVARLEQNET